MSKYNRKDENVDAVQWDGTNQNEIEELLGETVTTYQVVKTASLGHVAEGSWIMKNSDGTFTAKSDKDFGEDFEEDAQT